MRPILKFIPRALLAFGAIGIIFSSIMLTVLVLSILLVIIVLKGKNNVVPLATILSQTHRQAELVSVRKPDTFEPEKPKPVELHPMDDYKPYDYNNLHLN